MSECNHVELKLTEGKTDAGSPLYYCAAKCGAGLFVVKPLMIVVRYGPPPKQETK